MNGDVFGFTILPDQMQVMSPILILLFIPLFEYVVYPVLGKYWLNNIPFIGYNNKHAQNIKPM